MANPTSANCGCSTRLHHGTGLLRGDRGYRTARSQVGDWRRRRRRVHTRKIPTFAGDSYCAGGGTRTHTRLPSPDFESGASTNSATPAGGGEVRDYTMGRAPIVLLTRRCERDNNFAST